MLYYSDGFYGKILERKEIGTDMDEVKSYFKNHVSAKIAVESTMNWIPFYESLEGLGCDISLSNPLAAKAIAAARIKNDKVDSRIIADLLKTNLLPMAYIQLRDIRDLKEIVR